MKRTRVSLKDILQEDSRTDLSETQPENFEAKKENNKVKTEEQEHIEAKSVTEEQRGPTSKEPVRLPPSFLTASLFRLIR